MVIELILAEDIPAIAKMGDTILLKDDNTFEIKKVKIEEKPIEPKEVKIEEKPIEPKELEKDGTIIQKPFANYTDFQNCLDRNRDKDNPEAYCGSIKHKIEDEVNKSKYDPRIEKYLPNDKDKAWSILEKFHKNNPYFDASSILKDFINKVATCPDVTEKFEKIMDGWMRDGEADISSVEKIINSCKKEGGNILVEGNDKVIKSIEIITEILKESIDPPHSAFTYDQAYKAIKDILGREPSISEIDTYYQGRK